MELIATMLNTTLFGFDHAVYLFIFVVSLVEALPLIGFFLPGMVIVVASGVLVKLGMLNLLPVLIAASLGAIVSDVAGYFLGKRYGLHLLTHYGKYVLLKQCHLDATTRLMRDHTGKALVLGRFNSITRCFAPFIAGTTHTRFRTFLFYNVVGGVLWATTLVLLGYVFSQSYEKISHTFGKFVTIGIIVGVATVYLYRYIQKREHIFKHFHVYTLTVNVLAAYLFTQLLEGVLSIAHTARFDLWFAQHSPALWGGFQNTLMLFFTSLANTWTLVLFASIAGIVFIMKKQWHSVALLVLSFSGGYTLFTIVKELVERARPSEALITITSYSFPSGHTTMAAIASLYIIVTFRHTIAHQGLRKLFVGGMIALAIIVGYSRVYLNVHWATDVLAGFALGTWWFTFSYLAVTFVSEELHRRAHRRAARCTPTE